MTNGPLLSVYMTRRGWAGWRLRGTPCGRRRQEVLGKAPPAGWSQQGAPCDGTPPEAPDGLQGEKPSRPVAPGTGLDLRYNLPVGWDQVTVIIVTVVLAGTFYNNRRIDDVNRRFDDVSRRFDGVNARFDDVRRRIDDLRADVNARFAHVDTQLGELRQEFQLTRQELKEELREVRTLLEEALKARTS